MAFAERWLEFEKRFAADENLRSEFAANPDAVLLRETGRDQAQWEQSIGELTDAELHATAGGSGGNVVCPKCKMEFAPAFAFLLDVHMVVVHPNTNRLPATY